MLIAYLKIKSRIAYRVIAEIGLFRILFLLPFVGLFYFVIFKLSNKISYSWIITTLIFCFLIIQYNFLRKDTELLKILSKKYWQFFFVDNILISVLFILIDFRIAPILILAGYFIARLDKKRLSFLSNFKITRSIFKTGSIEWESTFRQHNVYMLIIWLSAFIFSIALKEKHFAMIALGGLGIDAGTVFLKTEPLWYIKQYRNKTAFLKHNFIRILFNVGLPILIFDLAIIAIFPDQFGIFILIFFFIIFYLIAAFTIRLAVLDHQLILNLIQMLFLALVIAAFFNIGLVILLFLFIVYVSITALKNLKMIYG
jgi:hypothetical protein